MKLVGVSLFGALAFNDGHQSSYLYVRLVVDKPWISIPIEGRSIPFMTRMLDSGEFVFNLNLVMCIY